VTLWGMIDASRLVAGEFAEGALTWSTPGGHRSLAGHTARLSPGPGSDEPDVLGATPIDTRVDQKLRPCVGSMDSRRVDLR
jgi:hypothetical protein